QHGVVGQRIDDPHVRRAVQDADRDQHAACAVSWRRAGAHRHAVRRDAGDVRQHPDLPLVADYLPGYEASAWYGLAAPKGTPPEIVDRLNKAVNEILADPKAKARFTEIGAILLPGSAADFGRLVADETEKWGKVVKFAGAKVD